MANGRRKTQQAIEPYRDLSESLKWTMFHRATSAYIRGDGQVALLSSRGVMRLKNSADAILNSPKRDLQSQADRDYVNVIPSLISEEERRLKAPPPTDAIRKGEAAFASKKESV